MKEKRNTLIQRLSAIHPAAWLVAILLGLMAWYGIFEIIDERPHPLHMWRNTDCLSITLNYHDHGMHFAEPEIHNHISEGGKSGKTAGEFPGWYYLMAVLWKVFGVSEALYRGVVGGLFILSLFALQNALTRLTGRLWATLLTLWMFVHPTLIYYGFAFLTNVPALSFALIGGSAFVHYTIERRKRFLYWSLLCFAIAGLLKVTALLLFCTIGALILFEWLGLRLRKDRRLFENHFKKLLLMALALVPIVIWYAWAAKYNAEHGGKYTFNSVWPLWEADAAYRARTYHDVMQFTSRQIMAPVNWILFGLSFVFLLVRAPKLPRLLWLTPLILNFGALVYSILWFQAWADHDYYFLNLYVGPLVTITAAIIAVQSMLKDRKHHQIMAMTMGLVLLWSAWYTAEHLDCRYSPNYNHDYITVADDGDGNSAEEGHLKYIHWDVGRHERAFDDIEPKLVEWGIGEEDLVISVPDASYCITLYLMDRHGFTNMSMINRDPASVREHIGKGARYLIVNEPEYEKDFPWIKAFMKDTVGIHRNVRVFRLSPDM
jgi:hypothetical protein